MKYHPDLITLGSFVETIRPVCMNRYRCNKSVFLRHQHFIVALSWVTLLCEPSSLSMEAIAKYES